MNALADRREEMLGLLAEKALALACAVQQRALEAETPGEMAALSGAFVKLSRSVRQSIALHAKLESDRQRGERQEQALAPPREPTPAERKQARVRRAVERLVWDEYDRDDEGEEETAFSLLDDLTDRLGELAEADDFLAADVDALIAELAVELGLEPPAPAPTPASTSFNGHAPSPRSDSS
jgi:hypothetical protein